MPRSNTREPTRIPFVSDTVMVACRADGEFTCSPTLRMYAIDNPAMASMATTETLVLVII